MIAISDGDNSAMVQDVRDGGVVHGRVCRTPDGWWMDDSVWSMLPLAFQSVVTDALNAQATDGEEFSSKERASHYHLSAACTGACERAEMALESAKPGAWRFYDGQILRVVSGFTADDAVVDDEGSMRFMAAARQLVPELIRQVKLLRDELRQSWVREFASAKRACADRAHAETTSLAASEGRTGSTEAATYVLEAHARGGFTTNNAVQLLRRWAGGEDVKAAVELPRPELR